MPSPATSRWTRRCPCPTHVDGADPDAEDGLGEGGEGDDNGFSLRHVPVKRKGARKR